MELVIAFGLGFILFVLVVLKSTESRENRRIDAEELETPDDCSSHRPCRETERVEERALDVFEKTVRGRAYITDGDGLVIKKTELRLFGGDAPEIGHPYGKKAKWALIQLCRNQSVTARIVGKDVHGRSVAICTLDDGRDLSAEMVKLGLALDWPKFSGGRYREFETPDARKKLWLADARQKGRMHVWDNYEARKSQRAN